MPATPRGRSSKPPRARKPAPRKPIGFDAVREIGLMLPDVEVSTAYGAFALKIGKTLLACTAINKQAEPGSLMVRIGFEDRDRLIAEQPDVYYLRDHYAPYPCVLVRLAHIRRDALHDLLGEAWRFVMERTPRRAKKRAKQAGGEPLDFAAVREIALALPEVEDGTSYGEPALKLRGKLFAGLAINKSAEPNTLGVRVSFEDRDRLIRNEPDVYYTTDHYVNYAGVLVRLARIRRDDLRELLGLGWRFVMEQTPKPRKTPARSRAR